MGILSLLISTCLILSNKLFFTLTLTIVPLLPLNFSTTLSFVIPTPATFSPSTEIILSPEIRPFFSDGPPGITLIITILSFLIENSTPIPSKLPCISSIDDENSSLFKYVEWGSSLFNVCSIELSTNELISTEST